MEIRTPTDPRLLEKLREKEVRKEKSSTLNRKLVVWGAIAGIIVAIPTACLIIGRIVSIVNAPAQMHDVQVTLGSMDKRLSRIENKLGIEQVAILSQTNTVFIDP